MRVLDVQNVHEALPRALKILEQEGHRRDSRNGPVIVYPTPVATVYHAPLERVVFWPQRDANPFFHLYEALWMLAGRKDLAGPVRFNKNFASYSDNGIDLHAAYGHRWRQHFGRYLSDDANPEDADQLYYIAEQLRRNPEDRRNVLQMWDATQDLGRQGKDLPCNLTATFQRGIHGELNMTVFCRSNDIVWGAYGANAVHFAFLQEYLARWIGCMVGTYTQISVNWHIYVEIFNKLDQLPRPDAANYLGENPYNQWGRIKPMPLIPDEFVGDNRAIHAFDDDMKAMLNYVDAGCKIESFESTFPFLSMAYQLFSAHNSWRTLDAPDRFQVAIDRVWAQDAKIDWVVAAMQWLSRRHDNWKEKQRGGLNLAQET